jgi:hypothetical protein
LLVFFRPYQAFNIKDIIMAVALPNGIIISLATTYGAVRTVTALTNAAPAVATTSVAHGITNGGIFELTSGWQRLNGRIYRATGASGSTLSVEGTDTTSVATFPTGTGTGSLREITAFTQITQITDLTTSGGDMQFATYSFLENNFESQLPTQASAQSINITLADDPSLAGYIALKTAGEERSIRALRMTLPGGGVLLYNGYVSFNETPTLNKGSINTVTATFSLLNSPVRYSA